MQKWIDFKKKEVKYIRILQDLKKLVQDSQKCSQKGHELYFQILISLPVSDF